MKERGLTNRPSYRQLGALGIWNRSATLLLLFANAYPSELVPVPSATNATLIVSPITRSEAGVYYVRATNALGQTVSQAAVLKVNPTLDTAVALGVSPPVLLSADGGGKPCWHFHKTESGCC